MIHSICITDPTCSPVEWWPKVEALKGLETLEFKPGLNILFGRNGSGKSTVLKLLARMLCCEQGDVQSVGQSQSQAIGDMVSGPDTGPREPGVWRDTRVFKLKTGVLPVHDGGPVMHFDPAKKVGLIAGSFDDDFFIRGIESQMTRGSSGQLGMHRMDKHLKAIFKGEWPGDGVSWGINKERYAELAEFLGGSVSEKGPPTILLDEPTRSLELRVQIVLLKKLAEFAPKVQIIMATHSPFALNLPGANYIELSEGYLDECREAVGRHFKVKS